MPRRSVFLLFLALLVLSVAGKDGGPDSASTHESHIEIVGSEEDRPSLEEFVAWSVGKGIDPSAVEPIPPSNLVDQYTLTYMMPGRDMWTDRPRGLKAKRDIQAGETVVTVPAEWAMSSQTAFDDPEIGKILTEYAESGKIGDRTPLAVFLLFQRNKGSASPWAPYIKMLPKNLHTPLQWTKQERSELRGTWLLDRTNADLEGVLADFQSTFTRLLFHTHKDIFTPSKYTMDDYIWAWSVIWARSIDLNFDLVTNQSSTVQSATGHDSFWTSYLVPYIDLAMNPPSTNQTGQKLKNFKTRIDLVESPSGAVFKMIVEDDYKAGEAVYRPWMNGANSWMPNVDLLRKYGVIDSTNPTPMTAIKAMLDKQDPDLDVKKLWLQTRGLSGMKYPYNNLWVGAKGATAQVAAFLRIHHFDKVEGHMRRNAANLPDPFQQISADNERAVMQNLQNILEQRLILFSTTVEEDERQLKDEKATYHQLLATEIRLEEKRALAKARENMATKTVKIDDSGSNQFSFSGSQGVIPSRSILRPFVATLPQFTTLPEEIADKIKSETKEPQLNLA